MIEKLESSYSYFVNRKESLFVEIEQNKQQLENVQANIMEKERYIEIQTRKERDESNIFNLYDTTNRYTASIKTLKEELAPVCKEEEDIRQKLFRLNQELVEITDQISSMQIMMRHLVEEDHTYEKQQGIKENNGEEIKQGETEEQKTISNEVFQTITNEEIMKRLQFCKYILDVDKTRCSLELDMLIDDICQRSDEDYKDS